MCFFKDPVDICDCSRSKEPSVLKTEVVMYGLLKNLGNG
jgi:hypothetical protein